MFLISNLVSQSMNLKEHGLCIKVSSLKNE